MHIGSWNVAGVGKERIGVFIEQLSDHYPWGFISMQEAFRRKEGVELEGNHALFTSSTLVGGLRCPAILVNERWVASATFAGSGARWVAVSISDYVVLISLHLPHRGHALQEYITCLDELRQFLSSVRGRKIHIGMDANAHMGNTVDFIHIGEGVTHQVYDPINCERTGILHEFLVEHRLYLANTFTDEPDELRYTRTNWSGWGSTQIDFIAVPL